jgi:hypothetical protein
LIQFDLILREIFYDHTPGEKIEDNKSMSKKKHFNVIVIVSIAYIKDDSVETA